MTAHAAVSRTVPLRLAALACVVILGIPTALWWTNRSDGRLHLIVPALAGDGALLRTAAGQIALIDGGADGAAVANWLGRELPLGRHQIDLLVQTRVDRTTLPGQLAAARRYHVRTAVLVRPGKKDASWDELVRLLREQGTSVHVAQAGERFSMEGGTAKDAAIFEILALAGDHALLGLTYRSARLLFLQSIRSEPIPSTVGEEHVSAIIWPWRRSTHDPMLQRLAPQAVIFGEQPGRDPQQTLSERQVGAARLFHEALDGRIELAFDSAGIRVSVERQGVK
jgi:beta-lactamase superfamily II metal-dependent hydrolase